MQEGHHEAVGGRQIVESLKPHPNPLPRRGNWEKGDNEKAGAFTPASCNLSD